MVLVVNVYRINPTSLLLLVSHVKWDITEMPDAVRVTCFMHRVSGVTRTYWRQRGKAAIWGLNCKEQIQGNGYCPRNCPLLMCGMLTIVRRPNSKGGCDVIKQKVFNTVKKYEVFGGREYSVCGDSHPVNWGGGFPLSGAAHPMNMMGDSQHWGFPSRELRRGFKCKFGCLYHFTYTLLLKSKCKELNG